MGAAPMVSVVMPVYNSAEYLEEAVDSILGQTCRDFEFIIVDDGSTDGSADILRRYQKADGRIRVLRQENQGISASRNKAIKHAAGKYIALMDSDDISLPERLAEQVAFMEAHPEVGICGVRCSFFGDQGEFIGACPPTDPKRLKCRMLFTTTISNTSIMMRRDMVETHNLYYDTSFAVTEDYEMYTRFLPHCEVANIPEVLLKIRAHAASTTRRYPDEVHYAHLTRAHRKLFSILEIDPTDEELAAHLSMCTRAFPPESREQIQLLERWLLKLIGANENAGIFDNDALSTVLFEQWLSMCALANDSIFRKWRGFRNSKIFAIGRRVCPRPTALLMLIFIRWQISFALEKSSAGKSFKRFARRCMG